MDNFLEQLELAIKEGESKRLFYNFNIQEKEIEKEEIIEIKDEDIQIIQVNNLDNINKKEEENKYETPINKVSLLDKAKGAKGAISRLSESGVFNKNSYCSDEELLERQMCCTTCTDKSSCPYCGCVIKGKIHLKTESCPSISTYPHLKKFPPKNYWNVTEEKTSIIISARNEEHLNKTIQSILLNATGKIEIIVGLDGYNYDVIKNDKIIIYKTEKSIGRRKMLNILSKMATGKYLLFLHAHCIVEKGFDTKMKCVCDENSIVSCIINSIDESKWISENNFWLTEKLNENLEVLWKDKDVSFKKIEKTYAFSSIIWMIVKDTFNKNNGFKIYLGSQSCEELEWIFNILLLEEKGDIYIRTDTICSHLFREKFPYEIDENEKTSLNVLKKNYSEKLEKYRKNLNMV